jgi:hypothetical protein
VQDNGGTANGGVDLDAAPNTMTVNVTSVNDAPVNTVPAAQATNEDTALVFSAGNGNLVAIADLDAGASLVDVTLTVTNGTLTLAGTAGLSFQAGANGTATMTVRGTVADLNTAMNGMSYAPTLNYNGAASLSITTDDRGATGTPGALTDSDAVAITVNPVNDAPVPGSNAFTVNDGGTLPIGSGNLSATDIDNAAGTLVFNVSGITRGRFELVAAPGVAIMSFTQQQILNGEVRFVHDGSNLAPTFSIRVTDGAAGVGPFAANIVFNPTGFVPPPPPPSGPPTVAPPPIVSMFPVTPAALPNPIAQDFLRSPGSTSGQGEAADKDVVEPGSTLPVASSGATRMSVIVPQTELLPVRAEPDAIETQPIRAEMHVIPTRHALAQDDEEKQRIEVILGSVRITGLAMSVGAVWWAARAAGIIASLLASSPAWRHVDPLPVLGRDEEDERDQEAVEKEDQDLKDEEHRAKWVLEGR